MQRHTHALALGIAIAFGPHPFTLALIVICCGWQISRRAPPARYFTWN